MGGWGRGGGVPPRGGGRPSQGPVVSPTAPPPPTTGGARTTDARGREGRRATGSGDATRCCAGAPRGRDCRRRARSRTLASLSAPGSARVSRLDRRTAGRHRPGIEEAMREEDFPAQQPQEEEEARVPSADAQPRRAGGAQAPPAQGTRPPVGLTRRVSGRAEFRSLAGARRLRSGVLSLASCPTSTPGQPRVAFAVPRSVGGAVDRNRVRRRLREAVRSQAALMLPGTAYLIGARRGAAETTYREIEATLRELVLRSSEGRT